MAVVLSIDAGTTGVRAMAINAAGDPVAARSRELTQHFPRPGWVEHDAGEIWEAVAATAGEVLADVDQPVAAIGITNQRETVVVWDRRTGRPLHRAIVWQDRRTARACRQLGEAGHLDVVRYRTGLVLDPYFSATKLGWLFTDGGLEPGPDVAFGTVDSWVLWCLTGGEVHATDVTNASRTSLLNIRSLAWDDELADLFGVPTSVLPEVRPSSGRLGSSAAGVIRGLPAGVPVSGAAGDQQAALFGQACFEPGMIKNTYGTGSFVLMNVGPECPEPADGLITTVAWSLERPSMVAYALEGAIFVTGAAIQWLRDQLGLIAESAEIGPLAASVPDTNGVYLVPAFTGLGSPWWDAEARGAIVGLTRGVGPGHLARAVVESIAYQTRDVVEAMTTDAGHPPTEVRVDGGASVMDLLLALQADQLGVKVVRAAVAETTALGAGLLAGLAEGVWDSPDDIAAHWSADATVHPSGPDGTRPEAADAGYQGWQRAVDVARRSS
ncbi:MAG: glycerol kinase GlpK [Actinomycetota bacterium]|nr:glycerol kinase GlpK [Actinomycetota bacterium]